MLRNQLNLLMIVLTLGSVACSSENDTSASPLTDAAVDSSYETSSSSDGATPPDAGPEASKDSDTEASFPDVGPEASKDSDTEASLPDAEPDSGASKPKLILHDFMRGPTPTPEYIVANKSRLDLLPFDGLVVWIMDSDGNEYSTEIMRNVPVSYNTIRAILAPIAGQTFQHLTDNFAVVYINRPADPFDDWSISIQNWANLARAVKEAGLKGIFFDNEEYFDPWVTYTAYPPWCPAPTVDYAATKTLDQYYAQTRLRGKQIMEAMQAEFPGIEMVSLHGPHVSIADNPLYGSEAIAACNGLLGAFYTGFVEGLSAGAKKTDGGELYGLTTVQDFQLAYDYAKTTIASDAVNARFIPQALRPHWSERVDISFGIYLDLNDDSELTPTIFQQRVTRSLERADRYVWVYPEGATLLDPKDDGYAGKTWLDAVVAGRAAAQP